MVTLVALAVFSGLSLNLALQFALGIAEVSRGKPGTKEEYPLPIFQCGVLFLALVLLWVLVSYILRFFLFGFLEYVLLLPLCALVCRGLEWLGDRFLSRTGPRVFNAFSTYNGLVLTALIISLQVAVNIIDAFVLALGFSGGFLFSLFLLREIRKRTALEQVPLGLFSEDGELGPVGQGLHFLVTAKVALRL
jgi:Na+-transporting NADH:ubiquinone oxidoreductase subunit NqrE